MKTKKHIDDFIVKLKEINLDVDFETLYLDSNSIWHYKEQFNKESDLWNIWFNLWEWHCGFMKDARTLYYIKLYL